MPELRPPGLKSKDIGEITRSEVEIRRSLVTNTQKLKEEYGREVDAGRSGTNLDLVPFLDDIDELDILHSLEKSEINQAVLSFGADPIIRRSMMARIGWMTNHPPHIEENLIKLQRDLYLGKLMGLDQTANNPDAEIFNQWQAKYLPQATETPTETDLEPLQLPDFLRGGAATSSTPIPASPGSEYEDARLTPPHSRGQGESHLGRAVQSTDNAILKGAKAAKSEFDLWKRALSFNRKSPSSAPETTHQTPSRREPVTPAEPVVDAVSEEQSRQMLQEVLTQTFAETGAENDTREAYEVLLRGLKSSPEDLKESTSENFASLPPYILLRLITDGYLLPGQIAKLYEDPISLREANQLLSSSSSMLKQGVEDRTIMLENLPRMAVACLREATITLRGIVQEYGKPTRTSNLSPDTPGLPLHIFENRVFDLIDALWADESQEFNFQKKPTATSRGGRSGNEQEEENVDRIKREIRQGLNQIIEWIDFARRASQVYRESLE